MLAVCQDTSGEFPKFLLNDLKYKLNFNLWWSQTLNLNVKLSKFYGMGCTCEQFQARNLRHKHYFTNGEACIDTWNIAVFLYNRR